MSHQPPSKNTRGIPWYFLWGAIGGGLGSLFPAVSASLSLAISRGGFCWNLEILVVITGCIIGLTGGVITKNKAGAAICGAIFGFISLLAIFTLLENNLIWWPMVRFLCNM